MLIFLITILSKHDQEINEILYKYDEKKPIQQGERLWKQVYEEFDHGL
jgi:hypothetical protein